MDVYPHICQIEKTCLKLNCFQKALPENQPDYLPPK